MSGATWKCVIVALAIGVAGCGSAPSAGTAVAPSPTGGLALDLLVRHAEGASSLYRVNRDGTLGWAGGFDAVNGNITWSGAMTPGEIAAFQSLMEANRWDRGHQERGTPASEAGGYPAYEIIVTGPRGREKHKANGSPDDVVAMEALLGRIARRRHDVFLDTFPKAGEERR